MLRLCSTIVWILVVLSSAFGQLNTKNGVVRLSSFPAYGKDSPFYLAQEAGFYKEESVEFVFQPVFVGALPSLIGGNAEIVQELCSEIMTAISRGAPLRIIAARDAHFPVATISLKSLGISTAASYEGKRWATSVGANPELTVMGELARVAGFDQHSIRIVNIPFNARAAALISDQADFASAWYGSGLPIIGSILAKAGIPYTYVRWSDFGIDIYGQCLAARNDWLETHSALAHAFLKATVKGFETAINSPSDAVSATIKQNPNAGLDASIVREQWSQAVELLTDDYSSKHGLLTMDPVKIEKTAIMANLSTNIHFFTNDYLPHY